MGVGYEESMLSSKGDLFSFKGGGGCGGVLGGGGGGGGVGGGGGGLGGGVGGWVGVFGGGGGVHSPRRFGGNGRLFMGRQAKPSEEQSFY